MAEIPAHARHYLDRTLVELGTLPARQAIRALRDSLETYPHALELFDAVKAELGPRGVVELEVGIRRIHVRDEDDPSFVHCPPLVEDRLHGPAGDIGEVPKRKKIYRKSPDMHDGEIALVAGGSLVKFTYHLDGVVSTTQGGFGDFFSFCHEGDHRPNTIDPTARPPTERPIALALRPELADGPRPVGEIAKWLVEAFDQGTRPSVRVRWPVDLPFGRDFCTKRIHGPLAAWLWCTTIPEDTRFIAIDGTRGDAIIAAPTRDAAITAIEREIWRTCPAAPDEAWAWPTPGPMPGGRPAPVVTGTRPIPLPVPARERDDVHQIPLGEFSISFRCESLYVWPTMTPECTPVVLLEIPARPNVPSLAEAGFVPIAFANNLGAISWGFIREDDRGWTMIGRGIADLVDPHTIAQEIREAEQRYKQEWLGMPQMTEGFDDPKFPIRFTTFRLWDAGHQRRMPLAYSGGAYGFTPVSLDPVQHDWLVTRLQLQ